MSASTSHGRSSWKPSVAIVARHARLLLEVLDTDSWRDPEKFPAIEADLDKVLANVEEARPRLPRGQEFEADFVQRSDTLRMAMAALKRDIHAVAEARQPVEGGVKERQLQVERRRKSKSSATTQHKLLRETLAILLEIVRDATRPVSPTAVAPNGNTAGRQVSGASTGKEASLPNGPAPSASEEELHRMAESVDLGVLDSSKMESSADGAAPAQVHDAVLAMIQAQIQTLKECNDAMAEAVRRKSVHDEQEAKIATLEARIAKLTGVSADQRAATPERSRRVPESSGDSANLSSSGEQRARVQSPAPPRARASSGGSKGGVTPRRKKTITLASGELPPQRKTKTTSELIKKHKSTGSFDSRTRGSDSDTSAGRRRSQNKKKKSREAPT
jgi:hypothetical protein